MKGGGEPIPMLNKESFKKPRLWLETHNKNQLIGERNQEAPSIPDEMWKACPGCNKASLAKEVKANRNVCPRCQFHFRLTARERLELLVDETGFEEFDGMMTSSNRIDFPGYDSKLESAKNATGEKEAVVCGVGRIEGNETVICVMESEFIMGSMGCVVGEKITRAFEYAIEYGLPVLVFCVSGGARMQEGILSLMQMAKISGAVKLHSDAGLLYVSVLTNPTTGGVTASFAMEGDIIIAEPKALIGFAGPRVIEQTIKQVLPQGFQSAEFLFEKGFLDAIVPRSEIRDYIAHLLVLHAKKGLFVNQTVVRV